MAQVPQIIVPATHPAANPDRVGGGPTAPRSGVYSLTTYVSIYHMAIMSSKFDNTAPSSLYYAYPLAEVVESADALA